MVRNGTKIVFGFTIAAIVFLIIGLNTTSGYMYAAAGVFVAAAISIELYTTWNQSRHSVPLESTVRDI